MDLKFTFGGASPDHHDHGGAPPTISLPLTGNPLSVSPSIAISTSNVLELRASISGEFVRCEGVSGDGVSYATAEAKIRDHSPAGYAAATRSALARAGASLPEPLLGSVTGVVLALGDNATLIRAELGVPLAGSITSQLQARTGIAEGTPIRFSEYPPEAERLKRPGSG